MILNSMYKKSGNPKVEELTKSYKERSYSLGRLRAVEKVLDVGLKPTRFCVWCGEVKLNHGNQKYCSPSCSTNAMAWAYPQKEEGLFMLLVRQDWKCNLCNHSWKQLAQNIHDAEHSPNPPHLLGEWYDWMLVKRLKYKAERKYAPEVDHVVPIYKGGVSLGLENHQAICYTCHKTKTGKDLSGKRKDPGVAG